MNWHFLKNPNSAENYVFSNKKIKNEMKRYPWEVRIGYWRLLRQNADYNYSKWSLISTNLKTAGEMLRFEGQTQEKWRNLELGTLLSNSISFSHISFRIYCCCKDSIVLRDTLVLPKSKDSMSWYLAHPVLYLFFFTSLANAYMSFVSYVRENDSTLPHICHL